MFDFGTGGWTTVDDYPYGSGSGIFAYDMLFISKWNAYIVIGGSDASRLAQIAKFQNGVWSNAGHLKKARDVRQNLFCFKKVLLGSEVRMTRRYDVHKYLFVLGQSV